MIVFSMIGVRWDPCGTASHFFKIELMSSFFDSDIAFILHVYNDDWWMIDDKDLKIKMNFAFNFYVSLLGHRFPSVRALFCFSNLRKDAMKRS